MSFLPLAHNHTTLETDSCGFTLIELVMVILLVGILSTVAVPYFMDMRTNAKNAATKSALTAMRSAIAIARSAIQLKEDPGKGTCVTMLNAFNHNTTPGPCPYPTYAEFAANQFGAGDNINSTAHPILSGMAILDLSTGIPANPWGQRYPQQVEEMCDEQSDCDRATAYNDSVAFGEGGWIYFDHNGIVFANSAANGGPYTEDFNADCAPTQQNPNEACY